MAAPVFARRPIKARNSRWAIATAAFLARRGVTPDTISIASIAFAALAAAAFVTLRFTAPTSYRAILFVVAIAGIQGRLLCNLLDGMVAIEGGMQTKAGAIFNDLPDRIADPLIIIPVGYAITNLPHAIDLAWLAALMAVLTAYIRVLGHSAGTTDFFNGPMAKQHRMATLTIACGICILVPYESLQQVVLFVALIVMALGGALTVIRRAMLIVRTLEVK